MKLWVDALVTPSYCIRRALCSTVSRSSSITIIQYVKCMLENKCKKQTEMLLLFIQRGPESEEGSNDSPTPVAASPEQYIKHPLQNR